MVILIYQFLSFSNSSTNVFGYRISPRDVGINPQFGGFGTFLGFLGSLIGALFLNAPTVSGQSAATANVSFAPNSEIPASSREFEGKLKPDVAALLCYVLYLLNPIGAILAIVFLNLNPYKRNIFMRFHAFQALLLGGVGLGLSLLQIVLASIATALGVVSIFIVWSLVAIAIFVAHKSFKNEIFKLPIIGDWAMNWANKNQSISPVVVPQDQPFHSSTLAAENYSPPASASTQNTEIGQDASPQKEASQNFKTFDSSQFESKNQLWYIIGALWFLAFVVIVGAVIWYNSSPSVNSNVSVTVSNTPANTNRSSASMSNTAIVTNNNIRQPVSNSSGDENAWLIGREGRLTMNLNLRSASNRNASSVGIHFQNARVRILDVDSYETEDGYATWYRVEVIEYGCDTQGNLGCGKNTPSDADEGWINGRYIVLN